jgi:gas vesicle protein
MGEDPRDVERRIEDTRERMGETVDALSAKADVPGRMRGYVEEKKEAVASKVSGAKGRVSGAAGTESDGGGQVADRASYAARRSAGIAKENPLGLAVGSVAAGFLVGMLLPPTRIENERLGSIADEVKDQAREIGGDAIEHGKQIAQDAAQAAAETAKQTGPEHAAELQESVRDSARQTVQEARS